MYITKCKLYVNALSFALFSTLIFVSSASAQSGSVAYEYDELGRLKTSVRAAATTDCVIDQTSTYTYDAAGNRDTHQITGGNTTCGMGVGFGFAHKGANGSCISVDGGDISNGALPRRAVCANTDVLKDRQIVRIPQGDYFQLKLAGHNKCLAAENAGIPTFVNNNGTWAVTQTNGRLQVKDCDTSDLSLWKDINPTASRFDFQLKDQGNGSLCLSDWGHFTPATWDFALWYCDGSFSQHFESAEVKDTDAVSPVKIAVSHVTSQTESGSITFVVSREGNLNQTFALDYTTEDGSALAGADYISTSSSLSFASGELTKTISVPLIDDDLPEGDEFFSLTVSTTDPNIIFQPNTGQGTITEDDISVALGFAHQGDPSRCISVDNGNITNGALPRRRDCASTEPIADRQFFLIGQPGGYFQLKLTEHNKCLVAEAAEISGSGKIIIGDCAIDDLSLWEDVSTQSDRISFKLKDETHGTYPQLCLSDWAHVGSATWDFALWKCDGSFSQHFETEEVTDISAPNTVDVSISDVTATDETQDLTFAISRSGNTAQSFSLDYITADGTALAGSDYTSMSGAISFAVGETSKTITVPVLNDSLVENIEYLSLALSTTDSNIIFLDSQGMGTIIDDDVSTNAPPVAVNDNVTVDHLEEVLVNLLTNDTDPDGDSLTLVSVTQPSNAVVTISNTSGTVTVLGTSEDTTATFTYVVSDGQGGTDTGTVTVTVNEGGMPF